MNILVCGNSGSGKTTLSKILSRVYNARIAVVHGDDFVSETNIDWNALKDVLQYNCIAEHPSKHLIFEHVSPISLFKALKIDYQAVFFLGAKTDWDLTTFKEYTIAKNDNKITFIGNDYNELIKLIIKYLQFDLGVNPALVSNFVLKIATHCNLSCSYCYMYEYFDNGKAASSKFMSLEIFSKTLEHINEYSVQENQRVSIGLHGGEPLLVNYKILESYLQTYSTFRDKNNLLSITVQTNGILLTEKLLNLFKKYKLSIGISIDGFDEHTNRKRTYHNGKSSFDDTLKSLEILKEYNYSNYGVISVISDNLNFNDLVKFIENNSIPSYELLMQDITHHNKNEKIDLFKLFKQWAEHDKEVDIRYFKSIISQAIGFNWSVDTIGIAPVSTLVVNTTGEWELLDTLRIVRKDAWKTNKTVFTSNVDQLLNDSFMYQYYIDNLTYSQQCLSCQYFLSCGGGYIIHRYNEDNDFKNPSVYCDDLKNIFDYIHNSLLN